MTINRIACAAAALSLACAASSASAEERIGIGTGGTGGLFYVVGTGMAEVINRHLPGAAARAEVTGASIENIRRVAAGREQFGFSSSSTLFEAKEGKESFKAAQPVAAVAYLYPAVLQIAVFADGPVKSIEDLAKGRINLGPPGSNSAVLGERLLKAYGVFDRNRARFLSYTEGANAMASGAIDAGVVLAGAPTAALSELANQRAIRLLSIDPARVEGLLKEYPFYQVYDIPAGTYKGQDAAVKVINDPAVLFAGVNVADKRVYDLTRTIFTHLDEVAAVHPQARDIKLETATKTPIPLHPGAQQFFDQAARK